MITDAAGNSLERSVAWASSDTSILTVASTGARSAKVTTNAPGTARITGAVEGRTGQLAMTVVNRPPPPPPQLQQFHAFIYSPTEGFLEISELPGATASYAYAVNNNGEVVGSVDFPGGRHAFIWSKSEGMTDLTVLPGQTYATASAINDAGQVAGWINGRSFRWSRSTGRVMLEVFPNTISMFASGINNNGDIVGSFYTNEGGPRAYRWTAARGTEELRTAAGEAAQANAINDSGQIVGSIVVAYFGDEYDSIRGVLWSTSGAIVDIAGCDVKPCTAGASSINQKGAATGYLNKQAYVWSQQGGTVLLPPLNGSTLVYGTGINASGQVTGYAYFKNFGTTTPYRAFVWSEAAGMKDLGFPPRRSQSFATAINDKGQIVGYAK